MNKEIKKEEKIINEETILTNNNIIIDLMIKTNKLSSVISQMLDFNNFNKASIEEVILKSEEYNEISEKIIEVTNKLIEIHINKFSKITKGE